MKRKLRLFKNDPFRIKEKYFRWQLDRCMKKNVEVRVNALKFYLNAINKIGVPRNDGEIKIIKRAVRDYDKRIDELEESLRYARIYVENESEVSE